MTLVAVALAGLCGVLVGVFVARLWSVQSTSPQADGRAENIGRKLTTAKHHDSTLAMDTKPLHSTGAEENDPEHANAQVCNPAHAETPQENAHVVVPGQAGETSDLHTELKTRLARVSSLSAEEALEELKTLVEQEARDTLAIEIQQQRQEALSLAQTEAALLISTAAQRMAGDVVTQLTTSVVKLDDDEVKGRIIGREGRNVRVFEQATGVDVIVDDTPHMVLLSCFDGRRREIARRALEDLVADGRIHPGTIEDTVARHREAFVAELPACGRALALEAEIGPLNDALAPLVGELSLLQTLGYDLGQHALQSARLAARIMTELGEEDLTQITRRAAFLHDIGRVAPHTIASAHAQAGAELLERAGESASVVRAVAEHHDQAPSTLVGVVVQLADQLLRDRPGARAPQQEVAVQRLSTMETIARGFDGVQEAWAMQSGNEMRVLVDLAQVSPQTTVVLSQEIAMALRAQVVSAGEVRVQVVRRAEVVEYGSTGLLRASSAGQFGAPALRGKEEG